MRVAAVQKDEHTFFWGQPPPTSAPPATTSGTSTSAPLGAAGGEAAAAVWAAAAPPAVAVAVPPEAYHRVAQAETLGDLVWLLEELLDPDYVGGEDGEEDEQEEAAAAAAVSNGGGGGAASGDGAGGGGSGAAGAVRVLPPRVMEVALAKTAAWALDPASAAGIEPRQVAQVLELLQPGLCGCLLRGGRYQQQAPATLPPQHSLSLTDVGSVLWSLASLLGAYGWRCDPWVTTCVGGWLSGPEGAAAVQSHGIFAEMVSLLWGYAALLQAGTARADAGDGVGVVLLAGAAGGAAGAGGAGGVVEAVVHSAGSGAHGSGAEAEAAELLQLAVAGGGAGGADAGTGAPPPDVGPALDALALRTAEVLGLSYGSGDEPPNAVELADVAWALSVLGRRSGPVAQLAEAVAHEVYRQVSNRYSLQAAFSPRDLIKIVQSYARLQLSDGSVPRMLDAVGGHVAKRIRSRHIHALTRPADCAELLQAFAACDHSSVVVPELVAACGLQIAREVAAHNEALAASAIAPLPKSSSGAPTSASSSSSSSSPSSTADPARASGAPSSSSSSGSSSSKAAFSAPPDPWSTPAPWGSTARMGPLPSLKPTPAAPPAAAPPPTSTKPAPSAPPTLRQALLARLRRHTPPIWERIRPVPTEAAARHWAEQLTLEQAVSVLRSCIRLGCCPDSQLVQSLMLAVLPQLEALRSCDAAGGGGGSGGGGGGGGTAGGLKGREGAAGAAGAGGRRDGRDGRAKAAQAAAEMLLLLAQLRHCPGKQTLHALAAAALPPPADAADPRVAQHHLQSLWALCMMGWQPGPEQLEQVLSAVLLDDALTLSALDTGRLLSVLSLLPRAELTIARFGLSCVKLRDALAARRSSSSSSANGNGNGAGAAASSSGGNGASSGGGSGAGGTGAARRAEEQQVYMAAGCAMARMGHEGWEMAEQVLPPAVFREVESAVRGLLQQPYSGVPDRCLQEAVEALRGCGCTAVRPLGTLHLVPEPAPAAEEAGGQAEQEEHPSFHPLRLDVLGVQLPPASSRSGPDTGSGTDGGSSTATGSSTTTTTTSSSSSPQWAVVDVCLPSDFASNGQQVWGWARARQAVFVDCAAAALHSAASCTPVPPLAPPPPPQPPSAAGAGAAAGTAAGAADGTAAGAPGQHHGTSAPGPAPSAPSVQVVSLAERRLYALQGSRESVAAYVGEALQQLR